MRFSKGRAAVVGGVATALAVGGLAPAGAQERTNSFSGSCEVPGTAFFKPPATYTDQTLNVLFKGPGKCSGVLNGRDINDEPVKVQHTATAFGACNGAKTTKAGSGAITFSEGVKIPYTLTFESEGTDVVFSFKGQRSGTASGDGTFLTSRTSPDIFAKCATSGAPDTPLDITLKTNTPFVSTRGGAKPGPGGKGGKGSKGDKKKRGRHLKLSVRPRRVRAGERTSFRFRVTTNKGRVKTGATVRFAGRKVKTRRGKARITVTLHRKGKRAVRASRRGYGSAKRMVVVR